MSTTDLIALYTLLFAFVFIVVPFLVWNAIWAMRDTKLRDEDNPPYDTTKTEMKP